MSQSLLITSALTSHMLLTFMIKGSSMHACMHCRHGVHSMSEAPLITPLTPLGEFITKLGRPAGKTALHTYLMRLREQGWDVSQTIKKALHCGASLEKEVDAHHKA